MKPKILILHATGTNRDRDVAWACELAGGKPEISHINRVIAGERQIRDYQMLILPGGFSYGDDLGAGKLWALGLRHRLADDLADFIASGKPVLGICNGFQVLVKSGLLPGVKSSDDTFKQSVTLTRNAAAKFECRWVYLEPEPNSKSVFIQDLKERIYCPVAHGEGNFVAQDTATLQQIEDNGLIALRYQTPDRMPVAYPWNPNGSQAHIAGICNEQGNVLGLMPHPENHIIPQHHPRYHRGDQAMSGLPLFKNGIRYAAEM
ncbi:MAG: phosphoribosylformylglycinamidine synthase I [Chloroflexota bacterium]